jgi:Flp pilus assembly protein TadG
VWSVRSSFKSGKTVPLSGEANSSTAPSPEKKDGSDRPRRQRGKAEKRPQNGSVAVEFAILMPILVALLSGIVTAGLGYNNVLGLADGVREGTRFGATAVIDSSWASSIQSKTVDLTNLNVNGKTVLSNSNVCVQLVRAPSTVVQASSCSLTAPAPGTPSGVTAGTCLVKVWAQIPVTLKFILLPSTTINVVRQSVSLYERGTC